MLKKILITAAILFFAFSVLFLSVFKATARALTPQKTSVKFTISPTATPSPTIKPEIVYYLAYPGILPDHFLYPLKMARDRIRLWLTTDPVKKAEVMLLYADKRLGAAKALIEGNKFSLGITTLEKGEKYLEQAVGELEKAKENGVEIGKEVEKFKTAVLKHEEVILNIGSSLSPENKAVVNKHLTYPQNILKGLKGLVGE